MHISDSDAIIGFSSAIILSAFLLGFIWLITKPKKDQKAKGGKCSNCGQYVENLGGHIDYCLDADFWKKL